VTGPAARSSEWFARGTASTDRILHGEIWRTVTALTLHADTLHVLGNALTGSIFLSAVNRRLGDGRGPLVVLLSGALGNYVNAVWHRTGHLSIGASTAVFAAVGVLAATQLAVDRSDGTGKKPWLERLAPVVGGLALLGMLGASPHSDLLAHLFGLGAGLVVGVMTTVVMSLTQGRAARNASAGTATLARGSTIMQIACALAALGLVLGSWAIAFQTRI
jgi:membrane associated rhomboid family serine protease